MAKNKKWSSATKFKIVLEVIKGECTLSEICSRNQVAPSQVHAWKKQFLEQGQEIFTKKPDKTMEKAHAEHERQQSRLYETIGQLTVERNFLKKNRDKYRESKDGSF